MIVLVTGVPGAGKTTLARRLSSELGLPLFSLDTVKEALFDQLGTRDRAWSLPLRAASVQVILALLPDAPDGALVDIWLDPHRDRGLAESVLGSIDAGPVCEVLCRVPGDLAALRYLSRDRHGGHLPPDEATLTRIRDAAAAMTPLRVGPAIEVDTSRTVDVPTILAWLREHGSPQHNRR